MPSQWVPPSLFILFIYYYYFIFLEGGGLVQTLLYSPIARPLTGEVSTAHVNGIVFFSRERILQCEGAYPRICRAC